MGDQVVQQKVGSRMDLRKLLRHTVESAQLSDGDEIQIGKYRLTFLTR